ncbi:MAG: hypothetical protein Q7K03_04215 [Dehalococcoidia bacterium]|nr:hypothetical protein [Dehalococcoidia bacterium]
MERKDALAIISNGHGIYSVKAAQEVCDAFGVSFPKNLVQAYESDRHPLGVTMLHGPEQGVWSLSLAQHVAKCLGVAEKAHGFLGRGSQAHEYARVVAEKLGMVEA